MVVVVTTPEEKSCLAPDVKLNQISDCLGTQIKEICSDSFDDIKNSLKALPKDEIFLIETKRPEIIGLVDSFSCHHTGELNPFTILLDDNKFRLKKFLQKKKIRCASGFCSDFKFSNHNIEYPCFVKPIACEDSEGVSKTSLCYSDEDVQKKLISAGMDNLCLIEEYLPGQEYTVAVIKTPDNEFLIFPCAMDIQPAGKNGEKFLDYFQKLSSTCPFSRIKDLNKEIEVYNLALETFVSIGATKYARIDIRDNKDGKACVIEVNLYPGLGIDGYLAECFKCFGLSYRDCLNKVLATAFLGG